MKKPTKFLNMERKDTTMRKIVRKVEREIDILVNYVLSEDEETKFVVYTEEKGLIGEFKNHYEALSKVKELSKEKVNYVYDDTYEVKYEIKDGVIIGEWKWPNYMDEYKERYIKTFNGEYKEELIVYKEEEELEFIESY